MRDNDIAERIRGLEGRIRNEFQAAERKLEDRDRALKGRVQVIDDSVGQVITAFQALRDRVAALEARVAALETP